MFPDEHGEAAYDDAGVGPFQGHPFPIEGKEYGGAEAGAEAGPGVGNDGENVAVGVASQVDGDGGNQKYAQAGYADEGLFRSILFQKGLEQVSGYGRRGDQKLGGAGTHNGCQDSGPDDAGDEGRRQGFGHEDEYPFSIGVFKRRREVSLPHHADGNGKGQGQEHPGHGNAGRFLQFLRVTDGHKFHKDMGLSEVPKAPAQGGNDHDQKGRHAGGIGEEGEKIGAFLRKNIQRRHGSPKGNGSRHGHVNDGEEHHGSLDEIRQRHRREAAQEGVENHHEGPQQERVKVGNAENGIKELACCHKAGGCVNNEEKDNEESTDEAQAVLFILEPVGQVVRNGEAVIGHFRIISKPLGHKDPVRPGADNEANARPERRQTMKIGIPRQSHEHPAAHIRSLGAHGRKPRSQLPVPQNVGRQILLPPGIIKADTHHQYQVQYKGQRNGPIIFQIHKLSPCQSRNFPFPLFYTNRCMFLKSKSKRKQCFFQ